MFRTELDTEIRGFVNEAINGREFRMISYYNLGRERIVDAVTARLHEALQKTQLGTIADLRKRMKDEIARRQTPLGMVTRWRVAVMLSVLLLFGGGTVIALVTGDGENTVVWIIPLAIVGGFAVTQSLIVVRRYENTRSRVGSARRRYREAVIEQLVDPVIREVVNERLFNYESHLNVQDAPGLLTDDPLFRIGTENRDRLENLITGMPCGSIGLAGPRGCGKTTLLRELCSGQFRVFDNLRPTAIMVTAPIEFAPRDFLLHLFAQICREALRDAPPVARRRDAFQGGWRSGFFRRHLGTAILLGVLCLIASLFVGYAALPAARQATVSHWLHGWLGSLFGKDQGQIFADTSQSWHFLHSLNTRLAVIGAVLFLAGLILVVAAAGRGVASLISLSRRRDTKTQELARRHLQTIKFQQSYSYGWSGSLTAPMAQVGVNEAFSLSEYQQSLPDIVASMREFLELLARSNPVIIAVDELDKVASDVAAAQFLNDLKGIFGVPGCLYLVSVSEEALSNFELRGLPFRDAFDSAFDEVLHLRPLTYSESRRLLQRRVVGLSAAYLCLCQCLAGGLPRDLVRVARDLVGTGTVSRDMCDVVAALVQIDLQSRTDGAVIALRRTSTQLAIEPMVLWINEISNCLAGWRMANHGGRDASASQLRASELLELCGAYPAGVYAIVPASATASGVEGPAATASRLGLTLAGFLYYLATLIELFRDDRTKDEFKELDESATGAATIRQVEYLTRARQAFAVSPLIAWQRISDFRASWGMNLLPSPGTVTG